MSTNGAVSLIHSCTCRNFGAALLSDLVLCFLCEPEQGNCLCYLVESTSSCVYMSFDILDCFYRQKPSSSQLSNKTKAPLGVLSLFLSGSR